MNEMIEAMIVELKLVKETPMDISEVETIYFGGGTPSLLKTEALQKLLTTVREIYKLSKNVEITLETNPDDISEFSLAAWKAIGINRFSIGVQSFKQDDLVWMNRVHNAEQALRCIPLVKNAGFQNFSVDLIYGTPTLSDTDWKKNVQLIIDYNVPHVSCYALTVEPDTALQKLITLNKKKDVDPEKQASQFALLTGWLQDAGYEHYEISNFAKPGYRSKHNSSYWQNKTYIGIGPSAHSFNGISRRWNVSNNSLYIQSLIKNIIPYEEEVLSDIQKLNEYIMTSLRTLEGIALNKVKEKFGEENGIKLKEKSLKYVEKHKVALIVTKKERIILTKEGKLFADGIAADLFFEEKN
jgi:oxygen-independent coproporphyrinogen-3 oxidase